MVLGVGVVAGYGQRLYVHNKPSFVSKQSGLKCGDRGGGVRVCVVGQHLVFDVILDKVQ